MLNPAFCFIDFGDVGVTSYVISTSVFTNLFVFISGKALVDVEVRCGFVLGLSYDFPWDRFHQLLIFVDMAG